MAKKKSVSRRTVSRRTRKNPEAWKFAVAIPVAAGLGYLLYRYVFMNEAQAAEMVEGGGAAPAASQGQIPMSSEPLPASGTVPSGAEGAQPATGPGGATQTPAIATPTTTTVFPASGQACFSGKVGNSTVKIRLVFGTTSLGAWQGGAQRTNKTGQALGQLLIGNKEIARISLTSGSVLSSLVAIPSGDSGVDAWIKSNFKSRQLITVSDAGFMLPSGTLAKTSC